MNSAFLVVLGGIAALLVVLLCVFLAVSLSHRRRTRQELEASREDVQMLHARLDALTRELESARREQAAAAVVPRAEYLITGVSTSSTGGVSTGGVSTSSTGGVSTSSTGGVSTSSTGGVSTGGVSTGGVSTGSTGGVSPGSAVVLSVALGEPLVKLLAFGYGVRRALSPESRNRIAFEMRREVRRARKQRRREEKDALRAARAAQREALAEGDAA